MSRSDPDVLARVVAIAGLVVATISLGFNIWKEWWRGKRIRVGMEVARTGATSLLVVNAHNAGNTSVAVIDWGFQVSGAGRARILPPNTGVNGPDLPTVLAGSQPLAPLSIAKSEFISRVRSELSLSAGEIKVRAYVIRDGGTRVLSRRRDAIRLQL
jgi:hypothetical protein